MPGIPPEQVPEGLLFQKDSAEIVKNPHPRCPPLLYQILFQLQGAEPPMLCSRQKLSRPYTEVTMMTLLTNMADKELVHMIAWAKKIPGTATRDSSVLRESRTEVQASTSTNTQKKERKKDGNVIGKKEGVFSKGQRSRSQ